MGVTPQGPVEANWGIRARICAAGKALEGHDRQHTNRSTGIIDKIACNTKFSEFGTIGKLSYFTGRKSIFYRKHILPVNLHHYLRVLVKWRLQGVICCENSGPMFAICRDFFAFFLGKV